MIFADLSLPSKTRCGGCALSGWVASHTPHLLLWPASERVQYTWME